LAIVIMAIGSASLAFLAQNKALQALDMTRGANAAARDAMLPIENSLRDLGWGIDPRFAIDLNYNCAAVPCRDRTNAPDELVFVARNPYYRWEDDGEGTCVTAGGCFSGFSLPVNSVDLAASPRTVTVTLPSGAVLEKGRVILVTCAAGRNPIMLRLPLTYTGTGAAVELIPTDPSSAPYNDWANLRACHGQLGAGMFLVDRYRYYVDSTSYGGVPWLMLDSGLDLDADGTLPPADLDDLVPIAKNVEDLQVAYVLQPTTVFVAPDAPAGSGDWVLGNNSGTAEEPDFSAAAPVDTTLASDSSRFTKHPANVRAIRVTMTIRSDRIDQTQPSSWTGDLVAGAENRTASLSGGSRRRYVSRTEIALRNMISSPFTF
jgi:type IV pilus assembly protein PilW